MTNHNAEELASVRYLEERNISFERRSFSQSTEKGAVRVVRNNNKEFCHAS